MRKILDVPWVLLSPPRFLKQPLSHPWVTIDLLSPPHHLSLLTPSPTPRRGAQERGPYDFKGRRKPSRAVIGGLF